MRGGEKREREYGDITGSSGVEEAIPWMMDTPVDAGNF